jgi:hypothetical protein
MKGMNFWLTINGLHGLISQKLILFKIYFISNNHFCTRSGIRTKRNSVNVDVSSIEIREVYRYISELNLPKNI